MPYFLIGLALLVLLIVAARGFVGADPKKLARQMRLFGGWGALGLAALFAVTGRFPLAVPLAVVGAMMLGRSLPFGFPGGFGSFPGNASKTAGQQSRVRTAFFEMSLDHDTGDIGGHVLQGNFAGRDLGDLGRGELIALWSECSGEDAQSAQLLAAYLDRNQPGWREEVGDAGADQGAGGGGKRMTVDEAYEILGLAPGASANEIRSAHRTLMKKLHPDQGGSNYLASKINEAKDLLLGGKP
ncbi:MAG: DnaJ domain-containing protein [Methyloligellaceae bacterium]